MSKPTHTPVLVRRDGTTTCCDAFTSIFVDDGLEYCKACFRDIEGHTSEGDRSPINGVDRCICGSKYWQGNACVDCGGSLGG